MSETIKTLKARGINVVHSDQTPEWYMIDARTSVHIAKWDVTLVLALLLVAILTPFEVAFMPAPQAIDWVFVMNRILDVIFAVDMVVVCFRIVSVNSNVDGMRWIVEPGELFRRYCKSGWFLIDLVTLIISAMDVITPMLQGDGAKSIRKLKMLRVLRVVRLTRLAKLLSNSRTLQSLETQLLIGGGTVMLVKCLVQMLLCCHWIACVWALQTQFGRPLADEPFVSSWLVDDGYCLPTYHVARELNATFVSGVGAEQSYWEQDIAYGDGSVIRWREPPGGWSAHVKADNVDEWLENPDPSTFDAWTCVHGATMYAAALYWSAMSITSIGYGDISATPRNAYEMYWAVALMLVSGICWSQVLATMTQVLATMQPADTSFKVAMDDLNRFMKSYELSLDMQLRLREYFQRTKHLQVSDANNALIGSMSPTLQGEVLLHCNSAWLKRVAFLAGTDPEFVAALVLNLKPIVFAPSETVYGTSLYIVHHGLALFGGKLLKRGMVWGEDMLLQAAHLRSHFCARALNYLEVFMISRAEVFAIAEHYPETYRKLRMYVCKVALRRMIVLMTREKNQLDELRCRFPDTLGSILDRLYDAEAERLRKLKNAGIYGGHASSDTELALVARKIMSSQELNKVVPPTPAVADVVEATEPLGAASATRVLARSAKSHPGREIYRAGGASCLVAGTATGTGSATGSDTQDTTNAPTPRDSASLAAARGAADAAAPPHRVPAGFAGTQKGGRPRRNNLQTEARVKATVDEAVAPLRQQIASLLEIVAAQHAEMLKAVATRSAAAAASGDAPMAEPSAQPTESGLLLTTSERLNSGATPAPPPATSDDVQPNVGRATVPSLRATPVLDC